MNGECPPLNRYYLQLLQPPGTPCNAALAAQLQLCDSTTKSWAIAAQLPLRYSTVRSRVEAITTVCLRQGLLIPDAQPSKR